MISTRNELHPLLGPSSHTILLQALSVHVESQEMECIYIQNGIPRLKVYMYKSVEID